MKRQVVGIVLAVVLAVVGTVALVAYVRSAKDDAVAGEDPVQVYVVRDDIAKGTTVTDLTARVELADVPSRLVADDAVTNLESVDPTLVADTDLVPGEQLLTSRLVDPRTLVRAPVPDGLQEITIALSPERAIGGVVAPGDTVGILFSFLPFQTSGSDALDGSTTTSIDATPTQTPNMTHFTLHKVLVTAIQFSEQDTTRAAQRAGQGEATTETTIDPTIAEAPSQQILVTLAVSASQAEQLVFAAEFGFVWLTAEGSNANEDGTRILTLDGVYVTVPEKAAP